QRLAPPPGHIGDGFRGAGQRAMQGVLGAAVDDPLGFQALATAQAGALHQQAGVAGLAQPRVEPEAGHAAADDEDIGAQGLLGHARLAGKTRRAVYTAQCPALAEYSWITSTPAM